MNLYETARELLRTEMAAQRIGVPELAARLQEMGAPEAVKSLSVKISRGRFQFSFVIQCLAAMGVETVTLQLPKRVDIMRSNGSTSTRRRPTAMKEARERERIGKKKSSAHESRRTSSDDGLTVESEQESTTVGS
jgi:Domain of unknown function (DUF6471)